MNAATVFVRKDGSDALAGSGVVVHRKAGTGLVMTTADVVAATGGRESLQIVLAGPSDEASAVSARVEGLSVDANLAFLAFESEWVPEPIRPREGEEIQESAEVFLFGFTPGRGLRSMQRRADVTVSRGVVSSKRRDVNGQVELLQLNGDVHPGNRGGPVVDGRGTLVGIATASIDETQIGFAIPARRVAEFLNGSLTNLFFTKHPEGGYALAGDLIDPLDRIASASLAIVDEAAVSADALCGSGPRCRRIQHDRTVRSDFAIDADQRMSAKVMRKWFIRRNVDHYVGQVTLESRSGEVVAQPPFRIVLSRGRFELRGPGVLPRGLIDEFQKQAREEERARAEAEKQAERERWYRDALGGAVVFEMEAPFEDVLRAGGDRYLVFKFPEELRLGIFDVERSTWHGWISIPDFDCFVAANRESVFVGMTSQNQVRRFDLETLREKHAAAMPDDARILAMAVGHASTSAPLMVHSLRAVYFLDPETLAARPVRIEEQLMRDQLGRNEEDQITRQHRELKLDDIALLRGTLGRDPYLRASADGHTFVFGRPTDVAIHAFHLDGDRGRYSQFCCPNAGRVLPGPRGRRFYSSGLGILSDRFDSVVADEGSRDRFIPASSTGYFLRVSLGGGKKALAVHADSKPEAIVELDDLPELARRERENSGADGRITEEKRFYLFAQPKRLITLPYSNDRIVIRELGGG